MLPRVVVQKTIERLNNSSEGHSTQSMGVLAHAIHEENKKALPIFPCCTLGGAPPNINDFRQFLKNAQPPTRLHIPLGLNGNHLTALIVDIKADGTADTLFFNSLGDNPGYHASAQKFIDEVRGFFPTGNDDKTTKVCQKLSEGDIYCGDWSLWFLQQAIKIGEGQTLAQLKNSFDSQKALPDPKMLRKNNIEILTNYIAKVVTFGKSHHADAVQNLSAHKAFNPIEARTNNLKVYGKKKEDKEKPLPHPEQLQQHRQSVKVYYDDDVFAEGGLNATLARSSGNQIPAEQRWKTKYRYITSDNTFFYNDRGEEKKFDVLMVTACAPNLRKRNDGAGEPENPGDYATYVNEEGRLKAEAYKNAMKRLWSGILYAADQSGGQVAISPMLGCGAYTRHLQGEDKRLAEQLMLEALQEVLQHQPFTNMKEFILSIPQHGNGFEADAYANATQILKDYNGPIPISVTNAGMLDTANALQAKGIRPAILNPSSDFKLGGGYTNTKVEALEEQLFGLSDAAEVLDGDLNRAMYDKSKHSAIHYDAGKGYVPSEKPIPDPKEENKALGIAIKEAGLGAPFVTTTEKGNKRLSFKTKEEAQAFVDKLFTDFQVGKESKKGEKKDVNLSKNKDRFIVYLTEDQSLQLMRQLSPKKVVTATDKVPTEKREVANTPPTEGAFAPEFIGYTNQSISQQARHILDLVNAYHNDGKGFQQVGIIYSANYGQTIDIRAAYDKGDWFTGTGGGRQAAVMADIETLLKTPEYAHLQNVFRIIPITTCEDYGGEGAVKSQWLEEDIKGVRSLLDNKGLVIGWQNEDANNSKNKKYAIGGGYSTQLEEGTMKDGKRQDQYVQDELIAMAKDYPVTESVVALRTKLKSREPLAETESAKAKTAEKSPKKEREPEPKAKRDREPKTEHELEPKLRREPKRESRFKAETKPKTERKSSDTTKIMARLKKEKPSSREEASFSPKSASTQAEQLLALAHTLTMMVDMLTETSRQLQTLNENLDKLATASPPSLERRVLG